MTTASVQLAPLEAETSICPGATQTAYVVWNPTAGSGLGKKRVEIDEVRKRFIANGWNVATVKTRCAGDGTEAARYALESGANVVVAMGGDGTINEVVQTLAHQPVPLGIIPVGTINVLSQELGLPQEPMEAIDRVCQGRAMQMDLGLANGRYFTMMVGLGLDAESVNALIPSLKAWSGPLAYWVAGVTTTARYKSVRARISYDDGKRMRSRRGLIYIMVISNTGLYAGGVLKFTPMASVRDGLFDVCLIRSKRWYQAIYHFMLVLIGRLKRMPDVDFFQTRRIVLRTARPLSYQLDGDPGGTTPITIEMVPKGLWVVGPEGEN
jgi:YegS/Rv2252/BmrU family lipid kinase